MRRYFPVFVVLFLLSLGGIAYSATISYDFWLYNSGVDTNPEVGRKLALLITVSVAVIAAVLVAANTGGIANYMGAAPFAERLTEMYSSDSSGEIHSTYQKQIADLERQKAEILHGYSWCTTHKKRHAVADACPDNQVIFQAKPKFGISRAKYLSDQEKIAKIDAQLTEKHKVYDASIHSAVKVFAQGVEQYQQKLKRRTISHRYLVFLIYILVFLATYQNARYAEQASAHLEAMKDAKRSEPPKTPQAESENLKY